MSVSKVSLIPVYNSVAVTSRMEQPSMNAAAMKDTFQMKTSVMVNGLISSNKTTLTSLQKLLDIDECLNASANNCSALNNEVCRNINGSYTCDCSTGYERPSQESEPCQGTEIKLTTQ